MSDNSIQSSFILYINIANYEMAWLPLSRKDHSGDNAEKVVSKYMTVWSCLDHSGIETFSEEY